ncbi:hypothetical protein BD410DRAFT_790304 [Rickenella mellea]|uniref:Ubiquitin-like domain-containing protein n=1 Tax=Rickenella mellea TaxID=50990 RepID=A0A4Y7Q0U3_9AGAM|nr:hypothetical protein BD410DRAFT_790304 [Rickenella mellea]
MNGASTATATSSVPAMATSTNTTTAAASQMPPPPQRPAKPPPSGPAPAAPHNAQPLPQSLPQINSTNTVQRTQASGHSHSHAHPASNVNGTHGSHNHGQKGKKKADTPVDPATMYESLKSRIAALEEEEVHADEEERRFAEEAKKSVSGMEENVIHAKYIELFAEMKRVERDHSKEKQKLVKDKDSAKSQLTKANQTKAKMENLARELQKDNKKLREDSKRLAQSVDEAHEEVLQLKNEIQKRAEKAKLQEIKYRDMPDIVVKVVCKYRAELFFKISRKTKLSRLFNAWTERMEGFALGAKKGSGGGGDGGNGGAAGGGGAQGVNGVASGKGADAAPSSVNGSAPATTFVFTHNGHTVEHDQTPEEAGIEDGDEILAVEMMDLTQGPGPDDVEDIIEPRRPKLRKNWTENPREAKRAIEEIFDGVVRERLKDVLRQYELRERHFECVIRSKELEVLLSRARAAEQKQLADGEKGRAERIDEENQQLKKELEEAQNGQTMLIDKLITCCKEPNAERTQRLFASLREELEKRGTKMADGPVGG